MAYKQLKYWFDKELARKLSDKIIVVYPQFQVKLFINRTDKRIQQLELKDRVEVIADELLIHLGGDYKNSLSILMQILGPENKNETGMFANYYWVMPIAKFVEKYGINDFAIGMKAIEKITKRNTGEYAIRPFIEKYPVKTLKQMLKWSTDNNFHVRRLSMEGGRPRLPWAKKLQRFIDDPAPLLPILNNLKDDTSRYVQKSVANCLHDILKDNPEVGKKVIDNWIIEANPERKWIIKHALRTLLKKENIWALEIHQACLLTNDKITEVHKRT